MIVQHHCPVLVCRWFYRHVASQSTPEVPADLIQWTAETWAILSDRPATGLAVAHVIDAHLVTHSPVEWMTELRRRDSRIESLERLCRQLAAALYPNGLDAVTTIPSRAEVESIREQLAGLVGTAACDG